MNKQDKAEFVREAIRLLNKRYPGAKTKLKFSNPLEILVATILSAQCTDERVNIVTKSLFRKYVSVNDYANADLAEFEQDIRPTGFYHNKAKNILAAAKMILTDFNGKVPDTMDGLLWLPGVARKTANVVMGNAYGKYEGIVVDTHVIRLSNLLGISKVKNAVIIEGELMELVPKSGWFCFSHLMQALGRDTCKARRPDHGKCALRDICPSAE